MNEKKISNKQKYFLINKLKKNGLIPIVVFPYFDIDDEDEAYNLEASIIKKFGRRKYDAGGILTNICVDNRPPHNPYSEERKELYKKMMLGNQINLNRKQSEYEKSKRSEGVKRAYKEGRKKFTEENAIRMSRIHKITSDSTKQKISDTRKNRNIGCIKVIVDAVHYSSKKEAMKTLKITRKTLERRINNLPSKKVHPVTFNGIYFLR